jgi:hypothetical protein
VDGIVADVMIHNTLVNLHGRCAGYVAARRALVDMIAAGATPDVVRKSALNPNSSQVEKRWGGHEADTARA